MSDFSSAEVLFNLGEGIDEKDLNAAQRSARGLMLDGILAPRAQRDVAGGLALIKNEVRVIAPWACVPRVDVGNNRTLSNSEGMLFIWTAGTGDAFPSLDTALNHTPKLLPYMTTQNELAATFDIGDGNPRIDVVAVKAELLEGYQQQRDFESFVLGPIVGGVQTYLRNVTSQAMNTLRGVKLTMQVVKGTPAGSPVAPALPAGYVALWQVLITAAFDAVLNPLLHVRDMRMPGVQHSSLVLAHEGNTMNTGWSSPNANGELVAAGGGRVLMLYPRIPATGRSRLFAISTNTNLGGGSTVQLVAVDMNTTPPAITLVQDITPVGGGGTDHRGETQLTQPIWDTGFRCSRDSVLAAEEQTFNRILALRVSAANAGDAVRFARFHFMGLG